MDRERVGGFEEGREREDGRLACLLWRAVEKGGEREV